MKKLFLLLSLALFGAVHASSDEVARVDLEASEQVFKEHKKTKKLAQYASDLQKDLKKDTIKDYGLFDRHVEELSELAVLVGEDRWNDYDNRLDELKDMKLIAKGPNKGLMVLARVGGMVIGFLVGSAIVAAVKSA